tara:strand:- start:360 stop:515 length:156 start_codon:yes stop_codon:yes gene_type:complete
LLTDGKTGDLVIQNNGKFDAGIANSEHSFVAGFERVVLVGIADADSFISSE